MESTPIIIYRVKPEDTLYSIARKFNTTINTVLMINGLFCPVLFVGQLLKIPAYFLNYKDYIYPSNLEAENEWSKLYSTEQKSNTVDNDSNFYVFSPDGRIQVTFTLKKGVAYYDAIYCNKSIIKPSKLGFTFNNAEPLNQNFIITDHKYNSFDENWIQPWGEVKEIRNNYNELQVDLQETTETRRRMTLIFRVYNYGLGFRYALPEQENLFCFEIMDEETEFVLADDYQAWWIPAFQKNRYEYLYNNTPISCITTFFAVHTPLTMKTPDGLYISIHEADLKDYASMTLMPLPNNRLTADLVPWSTGVKVIGSTPFKTPWRTIQIAEKPGDLITSYLILNLNEPNKLGGVSWVKPGKYVGIWWEMHIGKYTWSSGPKHGATTENAKRYIDFAAKYGFPMVLVEGWNKGWDNDWTKHGEKFDFITPYDDYDIVEVTSYAAKKGVKIIGHMETAAAIQNFERQMEKAFALYKKLGIDVVKTGYVGWDPQVKRLDDQGNLLGMEWHHGQYMVNHYRKVVETAARYHISLDVHEPIKDTGERRTYPNMMTREGARGQEYDAWSPDGGNPPDYTTIIPFTRMLAGPFDYTPGILELFYKEYNPNNRVNGTIAKQLALYVVIYSPLQMAADLPENYEKHRDAFQFIIDVSTDWQDTKVLNGDIGKYVTIARKDRNSEDWYLGSITNENGRTLEAPLTFLEPYKKYVAEIYADGPNADWKINPYPIDIYKTIVDRNTILKLRLAPGGGQAIRIRKATEEGVNLVPLYQ
ncbi:alpha-glucosidase [Clostridium polyendosporum]|uniref:Alpha-glucosidase n=1 Tax=Clostridium polyendosporum TaxID=69208 RepID=A0A919S4E1_9CLOT|nr:glycoside hydrolase family 97 catalytic domain-containing protein [Clostridium polyendosporum]GIM30398.1 alpha-glucosidase [Clostridium polyendosporum]